jgi:Tfp pilus assembly protein PilN
MAWMRRHSGASWPQPDFMPAAVRPGLLMWAWLLVAGCALLAAGWRWHELQDQRAVLAEQAALLSRMAPPEQAAAPNSAELQRRAAALAAQLAPPQGEDWASRWLAVEQALPPGLQLQALEMEGASLRLEGLAPQADLVMQLVDRLATQAAGHHGAASEVVLTRLQRPEGTAEAAESNLLRFEVVRRRANGLRS